MVRARKRSGEGERMSKHPDKYEDEPTEADLNRVMNNYVGYWLTCGAAICRRQRGCAGDAVACFNRFWPWTPESIKIRFRASIEAINAGVTSVEEVARIAEAEVARAAEHIARVDAEQARAWKARALAQAPLPASRISSAQPSSPASVTGKEQAAPRVRAL